MDTLELGNGSWLARPGDCRPLKGPANALASAEDAQWFAANPGREYRLRAALPGELLLPAEGKRERHLVVVRQPTHGFRIRLPFTVRAPDARKALAKPTERLCRGAWEYLATPEMAALADQAALLARDFYKKRSMH